jgi:hypothetical protein
MRESGFEEFDRSAPPRIVHNGLQYVWVTNAKAHEVTVEDTDVIRKISSAGNVVKRPNAILGEQNGAGYGEHGTGIYVLDSPAHSP